jgi:hypothetical protein
VVMSPRPGRISGVIKVPLGVERKVDLMRDPAFTDLVFEVRSLLGDEAADDSLTTGPGADGRREGRART